MAGRARAPQTQRAAGNRAGRKPAGGTRRSGPAGTIVRTSGKDGPQIVASDGHRWTDEAEEIFLDHLAATANYTLSAKRTGFSREAIYKRRRRDPLFDARCRAAAAQGVDRIDALLIEGAQHLLEGKPPPAGSPFEDMTVRDAIAIVRLHRPAATGEGRLPGWRGRPRSLDEVKASILRKLSAIERHRKAQGGGDSEAA